MLVVVGILAMVSFVFLDPLMKFLGGSGTARQNPVVVETRYGKLTQSDLDNLRQQREVVDLFLRAISNETINTQIQKGLLDPRAQNQALEQWYTAWHNELMGRSKQGPEEATLETLLLTKRAESAGMVVTDRAVNDFLKQVTDNSLSRETIQTVVASLKTGRRITMSWLFEAIRNEMLASRYMQLFAQTLRDTTPAQRFEYFSRLNRRAKIEFVPLAVADFIGQVPSPSDEELKKFFDEHKEQFPNPNSPDPGFKHPARAAFQYFKADFEKFKEAAKAEVTEKEVQEYYEKNKAQFRVVDLPAEQPAEGAAAGEAAATEETKPAEGAPAADETKPGEESKPTEEAKPEGEAKPAEAAEEPKASDAQPNAEAPAEPAKPEGEAPAAPQSSRTRRSPFQQVSYLQDAEPAAEAAASDAKPADETKPAEEAKPAEAAEKPAEEAKPADAAAPAESTPADAAAKTEEPKEEKFEPLEKVQDQIRDSLASQKAAAKIAEIFDELSAAMRRYSDEVDVYEASKGADSTLKKPAPFDFATLAKAKGVEAKELPLVTALEASNEDIGKVQRIVADRRSRFGFRAEPFTDFAFSESLPKYRPNTVQDNEGNGYLFWKTQEEAAYVPTFDQSGEKETVERAWKMIKARDLARQRADEYAVQARASGKPLKEVFEGQAALPVTETDWFSWLTTGNVPSDPNNTAPRLSTVEGVDGVGEAFMSTVFGLEPGGLGVTSNHPQNTVYLVRLVEFERPLDELRHDFYTENPMRYMAVADPDRRKIFQAWVADLSRDAKVHWERPADQQRRRGDTPVSSLPADDMDF